MPAYQHVKIGEDTVKSVTLGNDLPLVLIAGPCALESREHALDIAGRISALAAEFEMALIYKTSFDKANRTSASSPRGIGLDAAIPIFESLRKEIGCPVLTDIHSAEQAERIAPYVDVLQIPAFLCRQSDLLQAAGRTGKPINIKKGQFMAPWDMVHVARKIIKTGNHSVLLCERGACFGYNALIADMRSLPLMAQSGWPVVMDVTHSVQQPGAENGRSGGDRRFAPLLARSAVAAGVAAVFAETHQDPETAPSDGANMIRLQHLRDFIEQICAFDRLAKSMPYHMEDWA